MRQSASAVNARSRFCKQNLDTLSSTIPTRRNTSAVNMCSQFCKQNLDTLTSTISTRQSTSAVNMCSQFCKQNLDILNPCGGVPPLSMRVVSFASKTSTLSPLLYPRGGITSAVNMCSQFCKQNLDTLNPCDRTEQRSEFGCGKTLLMPRE